MKEYTYKYDAFISYRHNDLDKFVAENLHRLIETYKMPKPVVEKYNITDNDVRRVFRDQDELPLSSNLEKPIIEALEKSRFLIVICSPRLKESVWCKKEIESFIKMHGRSHILCVLVEGEPKDSFPEILQYYEEEVKDKSGKKEIKKIPCEPLAMDVRGNSKKEIYKKLKEELIRVIAPMYNLDYDDIKRRHEERELKRKAKIFKIIAIVSILFALYSFFLFFRIYTSSKQLKYDQSINLANQANELLLKDNRKEAIKTAYQSVTKYNNIKMPITPKGIYELTDSLGLYYLSTFYYSKSQLDTLGVVENIKTNLNQDYLLSYDNSGELVLWKLEDESRVITLTDTMKNTQDDNYTFIGNNSFVYLNNNKEAVIVDLQGKEIKKIPLDIYAKNVISSSNGEYIEISDSNKIYFYETESFTNVATYEIQNDLSIKGVQYFDKNEENLLVTLERKDSSLDTNDIMIMTYNIDQKTILANLKIDSTEVRKIVFKDDIAVVQSSRKTATGTDMLITSYNYKNGAVKYKKEYKEAYATDMKASFPEESESTILVSAFDFTYLLDFQTGEEKTRFAISDSEANIYTFTETGNYALFTTKGDVYIISGEDKRYDVITYVGFYNFKLSYYKKFVYTNIGILAITNENRVIIYGFLENKDIKQIEYEEKEFGKIDIQEKEKIIEEYNFKMKNLILNLFYSNDKKLLFVTYNNNLLEIYNAENKKLIKSLDNLDNVKALDTYICKTDNKEHIINGSKGGYILNKDYDVIAYVPQLYDYNDGKIILKSDSGSYYEVKKYTDKEIIKKAKELLKSE